MKRREFSPGMWPTLKPEGEDTRTPNKKLVDLIRTLQTLEKQPGKKLRLTEKEQTRYETYIKSPTLYEYIVNPDDGERAAVVYVNASLIKNIRSDQHPKRQGSFFAIVHSKEQFERVNKKLLEFGIRVLDPLLVDYLPEQKDGELKSYYGKTADAYSHTFELLRLNKFTSAETETALREKTTPSKKEWGTHSANRTVH